jgi:cysteine sulfinate desulfinase/cysteine desulfurase-like protein
MGVSEAGAQASLRFTMGASTTEADIKITVQVLHDVLAANSCQ